MWLIALLLFHSLSKYMIHLQPEGETSYKISSPTGVEKIFFNFTSTPKSFSKSPELLQSLKWISSALTTATDPKLRIDRWMSA